MKINTFSRKCQPLFLLGLVALSACGGADIEVQDGVSLQLAQHRAATISDVNYRLWFGIPPDQGQAIDGIVRIEFSLSDKGEALQLDFRESADNIASVIVNGEASAYRFRNEHIVIPADEVLVGRNAIDIEFTAGDSSLNRNPEYLYTLFVPDRARTAFPLFDQPDLKATFELTLRFPEGWTAISNAPINEFLIIDHESYPLGIEFEKSDLIPTYLFSFVAGKFETETGGFISKGDSGRSMTMLHRETDAEKVARNVDEIFRLHMVAINWLEEYSGIDYPFAKLGFALIPSFQYGGMEHVGAIQYRASSLLLDENPSDTELLSRASLIAHEVSHMWFGNLVTMQWFNDVWTKEVFANFMAAKIVNPDFPDIDHDLNFLMRHHPRAYAVDRSEGANPIRQELHNLNEAGQMYGAIIYNKAPIMMRQLELIVGEEPFREGMREYLGRYSYSNATWPDLIAILDAKSDADLTGWSEVWVNTSGRPEFSVATENAGGDDPRAVLRQSDPSGQNRIWPQSLGLLANSRVLSSGENAPPTAPFEDALISSSSETTVLTTGLQGSVEWMPGMRGMGYGLFPASIERLQVWDTFSNVDKGSLLINVHENLLEGRIKGVDEYLLALLDIVAAEQNQLLQRLSLDRLATTYRNLLTDERRSRYSGELESVLWQSVSRQPDESRTKTFFMAYARLASDPESLQKVYDVWSQKLGVDKLTLSENDNIELAQILAIRLPDRADEIIQQQLQQIENPDSRRKLEFIAPSLSPIVSVRDEFFASLKLEKNRQTESWVLDALENLHHPSRISQSEKYILPSLELLQEIQVTGDIFFPTRWLVTNLQNHQSDTAVNTVRGFLAERPDYNAQLRMKILQAADMLFRSNAIIVAADTDN